MAFQHKSFSTLIAGRETTDGTVEYLIKLVCFYQADLYNSFLLLFSKASAKRALTDCQWSKLKGNTNSPGHQSSIQPHQNTQ